jgi:uncharacterized protein YegL
LERKEEKTMSGEFVGEDDLVTNTAARVPVCLCLDVSGSMGKSGAIEEMTGGVKKFYDAIRNGEQTKDCCEIAIVTFSGEANVVDDFSLIDKKAEPTFTAGGGTALAHGINKALDILEARKAEYKKNGVEYYQPWLVIMTDGKPGDKEDIPAAQARCSELVNNKKLTIFPIVIGTTDNEAKSSEIRAVLDGFSPKRKALVLKDLKFEEFFEWLGKSVGAVADTDVGDKVALDAAGVESWGSTD